MVLNIKAFLEKKGEVKGEIRRFQVPSGTAELYRLLSTKVAEVFCLPENGFRMFWQGETAFSLSVCIYTRVDGMNNKLFNIHDQ